MPGAPSLGKMVAAARYRLAPRSDRPWPARLDELPEPARSGTLVFERHDDGGLTVELSLRPDEGPVVGLRDLLAALGVTDAERPLVRVQRKRLRLKPPGAALHPGGAP